MSRLLCCLCARHEDMGAALSHAQDGEACEGAGEPAAPPTMADVIRERKKKAGGAGLGTLRRRIAAATRRPRDTRPDRGCEHARYIRSTVSSWRVAEVFVLCAELEAGAALRDLLTRAELAREPAPALHIDLAAAYRDRWWCDVELVGAGWSVPAHRAILAARCTYFRDLLQRYPPGCCRVPLEGACAALSRAELEACVRALYAGPGAACRVCDKYERSGSEGELDIINVDNSSCGCSGRSSVSRRLAAALGFSPDSLHRDMKYLLDSGEMADARLVFRLEGGCGAAYGFRTALELPCHRLVLAARSRFFRSVMSRRAGAGAGAGGGGAGGAVCVDEKVLPRRFARALLHAAYTDQVDLSLIGRNSSSPSSTNTSNGNTSWTGVSRGARPASAALLDDAFQLYEIARFVEMPIVVQGCEDAIVEALSAETLPHVLRWAAAPHASQWVHRQAMRYLRDEFPSIMSVSACGRLPSSALAGALASPFLQASEACTLRALVRWAAERSPTPARARRGAAAADCVLRDALAALLPLVRLEHLPPDHDLLAQLVRRGVISAPVAGGGSADAWLGRGAFRPARCFLPYLDEIKALLEDQAVPEAEISRVRRERYLHRIPDTLYMVAAARGVAPDTAPAGGGACAAAPDAACVQPALLHAVRARVRELVHTQPQARALKLHHHHPHPVYRQIVLRAVREMSLPDSCAELLLAEIQSERERGGCEWESPAPSRAGSQAHGAQAHAPPAAEPWPDSDRTADCCRSAAAAHALHSNGDNSRAGTCRRDVPGRSVDTARHREGAGGAGGAGGAWGAWGGRLSAAVPDVAMAPNANTHLLASLSSAHYVAHPLSNDYGGVVLQLDLGDGATHTPRPGSRAQRAGAAASGRQHRDHAQAMSCLRARPDDDELRAAIELSVIRAYSSLEGGGAARGRAARLDLRHSGPSARSCGSPGPPGPPARDLHTPPRLTVSRAPVSAGAGVAGVSGVSGVSGAAGVSGAGARDGGEREGRSPSHTPSPRRLQRHDYSLYRHDYRLDPSYGGSASTSRGHSPNNYA